MSDDGPASDQGTSRGFGLIGLDERVAQAGGRLLAGPRPDCSGYELFATLPTTTGVGRS